MKTQKNRELIQAQKMDQSFSVDAFCSSGYYKSGSRTYCSRGYSCNWFGYSNADEDDDVLL